MTDIHKDITIERVMQAVEDDNNVGFCLACGNKQLQREPGARAYICETCNAPKVYGAKELLFILASQGSQFPHT